MAYDRNKKAEPTKEQSDKIDELRSLGYVWDKGQSISAAGVVMTKDGDIWAFSLDGEIVHVTE
jgi:streptogramin lyase